MLDGAVEDFATTCLEDSDLNAYLSARREVEAALDTMGRLREARLGPAATGNWFAMQPDSYTREQEQEWMRSRRAYSRRVS